MAKKSKSIAAIALAEVASALPNYAAYAAHTPAAEDLDWAEALVAAVPAHQTNGAFLFRGHMVDEAVLRKARRILEPRRHQ